MSDDFALHHSNFAKYGIYSFVLPSKGCPVFMLVDVFCHCPKLFCGKHRGYSPHICGICFAFSPQKWQNMASSIRKNRDSLNTKLDNACRFRWLTRPKPCASGLTGSIDSPREVLHTHCPGPTRCSSAHRVCFHHSQAKRLFILAPAGLRD